MLTRRMDRMFAEPGEMLGVNVDRLFNDLLTGVPTPRAFPPINVWEDENAVFVEAELPGYTDKDVDISLHGTELTIAGARSGSSVNENATVHRRERWSGRFTRTLRFATPIDPGAVEARFESGVLTITLKKTEAAKPRKIEVVSK